MSKRNTTRSFDTPAYYHVFNRGAGKQPIFLDAQDRAKFISLMARYLDPLDKSVRSDGLTYKKSEAKVVAYCLMRNHFHFLLYQDKHIEDIQHFMSSLMTAYSMYFNKRHKRSGRLFEGPYRAKPIESDSYLLHISRYIHLNPRTYRTYKWSSLPEYDGRRHTTWVHSAMTHDMSPEGYIEFLEDYESRAELLKRIKDELELGS